MSISKPHIVPSKLGGGVLPEHLNLVNLIDAVDSIPTGPTLRGLKRALNAGTAQTKYPIGTVIPDEYNGQPNPLIVVAQREVVRSDGVVKMGAYLQRSYVTDTNQKWDTSSNLSYANSAINVFLNNTYLQNCSTDLRNVITEVEVPIMTNTGAGKVKAKCFSASVEEVYGNPNAQFGPTAGTEGSYFPYWKDKTGLSSPSNNANPGRIAKLNSISGADQSWQLRSRQSILGYIWAVAPNGMITQASVAVALGVLPVCVVTAD